MRPSLLLLLLLLPAFALGELDEYGKDPNPTVQDFKPMADSIAGGGTCSMMQPFCPNDGTAYQFFLKGSTTGTTANGDFGCLSTHPGEQWLYVNIAGDGNMKFKTQSAADHDYAIWGPYNDKAAAIAGCGNLPAPVDCSFDPRPDESHSVLNVKAGETYILILTNYANVDQNLVAEIDPNNTAGYDCQDVIDILQPTGPPTTSPTPAPTDAPTVSPTAGPTDSPTPAPNEKVCECWSKPDVIACPLVRMMNYDCDGDVPFSNYCGPAAQKQGETECGGGSGIYNYECDDEELGDENSQYILWNLLPIVYKIVFLSSLHFLMGCTLVDFGETDVLCFRCNNSFWLLVVGNLVLILLIYLSRCFMPIWALFFVIWLHFDCVLCLINRSLNKMPKAAPKPTPPRSNLELFAYTNHKKSWKDKAYATFELRQHKKDNVVQKKIEKKAEKLKLNKPKNYKGGAY